MEPPMESKKNISRLVEIMAALRTPGTGCPWDLEQDFNSIAPYTIEEAYEVADAIERRDWEDLCDELGDLLLQPIYHARMAEEAGYFDFDDVIKGIIAKMIRRHPHVFGDATARKAGMAKGAWDKIKDEEKSGKKNQNASLLDDVPAALPALQTALKLQKKAGKVGFDWNDATLVIAKIREELEEVEEAIKTEDRGEIEGELGDVLFAVANLARHLEIDPDMALRTSNRKFRRRFAYIEKSLKAKGSTMENATLEEMEALWVEAKGED